MTKGHVLVIDDDSKVASLLRRSLSYEGYTVDVGGDGKQGLALALGRPPDLVILDVMMPDIDGIEVCRRLRADGSGVPILMLTAKDAVADRVLGLDTGADDYLIKPFALEELMARVRAHLRRRDSATQEVLRFADVTLDTSTRQAQRGERPIELSTTEYELLALFLRNPGQVLTRDVILDRVWGYDFDGGSNVLEVYIYYLRSKLEESGEKRLIHTVRGAGYVLKE